ncbi:synaptobrevin homolog YKT6-like [Rhopilema esculentum]|uniref:synaptobrevin homolog YKT6-like n=1 Tax=Rhopilema esculentum TaxID=499914 RepID=UPI0031CEB923|eukprot:gene12485-3168_t
MKLYAVIVLHKGTKTAILKGAHDLQSFGYFQRSSVREFMDFTAKLLVERTQVGLRASVKEQEYLCHVFVRNDSLSGVVIADKEYPSRVAFTLIGKLLDEFSAVVPSSTWKSGNSNFDFQDCEEYLQRFQNPREADPMMRVQSELDETKVIVYNTIEQVLQRGEKLDELVTKSEGLSTSSKAFYTTARKTNSCCGW